MILKKSLTILFVVFLFSSEAQQIKDTIRKPSFERELCLLTAINYSNHTFIDLGIAKCSLGSDGHHPLSRIIYAGSEFHLVDRPMIAPKIGVWAAGGVAAMVMGLNLLYQTDFDEGSLIFRPEIGMGLDKLKLTYGYNVMLTNKRFERVHENSFSLTYCFRLRTLKMKVPVEK